ncbi:MAG: hypothetical protein WCF23_23760 [Candidatus Nitrosopolaris sp.]
MRDQAKKQKFGEKVENLLEGQNTSYSEAQLAQQLTGLNFRQSNFSLYSAEPKKLLYIKDA